MAYRILSLDGGGTWALLQVRALQALFPGDTGHQILSRFDLAVANSGGSIVLAGLMRNFALDDIANMFLDKKLRQGIFHEKSFFEEALSVLGIFPKYDAAAKRKGLAAVMGKPGETTLSNWQMPMSSRGLPVKAMILTFDYSIVRAEYLRTYPIAQTGVSADAIELIDAVHASSNAPVKYFDAPAKVGDKRYWDGAMGGYNNPVMAGVVDALVLGNPANTIEILSIGTGTVRLLPGYLATKTTPADAIIKDKGGIVSDAAKAGGCINDDPPDSATFTAHILTGNGEAQRGRLVRLNPVIQPVKAANGQDWTYPSGLNADLFKKLANLDMDAVEDGDVALIDSLARIWIADQCPNQPIRMRSDLSCGLGDTVFSSAKVRLQAMGIVP